jgi:hypothetical protein
MSKMSESLRLRPVKVSEIGKLVKFPFLPHSFISSSPALLWRGDWQATRQMRFRL